MSEEVKNNVIDNKEIVTKIVKLQVLCARYVERHTSLRCYTNRDLDRILMQNKFICTYGFAIENLYKNTIKYCSNCEYLMQEVLILRKQIEKSNIKNLRFGLDQRGNFTKEENELDELMLKYRLFMLNEYVSTKEMAEILGGVVTASGIKQACINEKLLNTKKVGNTWLVHIPECRAYWNIPDIDENNLYVDYTYYIN